MIKQPTDSIRKQLLQICQSLGAQYLLLNKSELLLEVNAGFADISNRTVVDDNTTFHCFSSTKTFTGIAILQLMEEGKLSLDDCASDMLSEFRFSKPFTIRHLLSHQSGLGNPMPVKWIHLASEDDSFDENKFLKDVISKNARLKFLPGSKFSYSNLGFLVLGKVIEKSSGIPCTEFIRQNIIGKIQEANKISFAFPDEALHATGYHANSLFSRALFSLLMDKNRFIFKVNQDWLAFRKFYLNGRAYGGLISNAKSLAAYLQAVLNRELLSPEYTTMMFTEQMSSMCLGWFTGEVDGRKYYCHSGGGGAYGCEIRIYPSENLASVVMFNRSMMFRDERILDKIDRVMIPLIEPSRPTAKFN